MYASVARTTGVQSPSVSYEAFRKPLLAYVQSRLEVLERKRGEDIARMAFARALGCLTVSAEVGMVDEGLPAWLASAARTVIREQTSAATVAAERFVTVTRSTPAVVENSGLLLVDAPAQTPVSGSEDIVAPVPLAA